MRYNILIAYLLFTSIFVGEAQIPKKYGVVNLSGEVVVPMIYEEITPFHNGYARIMRRDRYGVIDSLGREVLECKYHGIRAILPDRVIAMLNGRYGVIDFAGNVIVPFDHRNIISLPNGFYLTYKSLTCGVYNDKGDITVPFSNSILVPFSGNRNLLLATNTINQNSKIVDCNNKEITAFTNKRVRDLGNGFLGVEQETKDTYTIVDINAKEINSEVKIEDNQAFVGEYLRYSSNGKLGVINIKGEQILPPQYKRIFDYIDGHVKVVQDSTRFGDNQFGLADGSGQELIPCMYDGLGDSISDGRIVAYAARKYGYLDRRGYVIVPFDFDSAEEFKDRAAVVSKEHLFGVIDTSGRTILPFQYNQIKYLGDGVFAVLQNRKWTIVNRAKQKMGWGGYDAVGKLFANKYIAVCINRKWAVIDYSGNLILPFAYSSVDDFGDGIFTVGK